MKRSVLDSESSGDTLQYVAPLSAIRDRLDLLGYPLARVQADFRDGIEDAVERHREMISDRWFSDEQIQARLRDELIVLENLTLEDWIAAFGEIVEAGLRHQTFSDGSQDRHPTLFALMLRDHTEFYGFPSEDFYSFLRATCEIGTSSDLIYDLSDLAGGGWIDPEEDLCAVVREDVAEEFLLHHKIVILTEGKSDKWILESSLALLYPHLSEYYAFMDFEGARAPGGAGILVATVKAFVGAGIANRTVALFDNDTAALSAMRTLREVSLPRHLVVLRYPPISLARQYPTLGPTGIVDMDVNGLAGSIELYFGEDILRQDDGTLVPIQWRGYDDATGQYQGEILHKANLQKRFAEKVRRCQENPRHIAESDWSGILAILDHLREAFSASVS